MRRIDFGPLDDLLDDPALSAHLSGRAQLEFSAGIVGVALAYVSLNDQLSKMNGILDAGLRAQGRLLGMGLALAGGAAELVGKTLEHGRKVFFAEARFIGTQRAFMVAGRFLGLAGGLILGAMDVWEGIEKISDGERTIGVLYLFSGGATALASIFISLAATGAAAAAAGSTGVLAIIAVTLWWTGLALGIVAIAAAVGIWWKTEDDLQEWLALCAFGERGELGPGNAKLEVEMQRIEAITHKET